MASSDLTAVTGQSITYTATVTAACPPPETRRATWILRRRDAHHCCTAQALTGTATDTATCTVTYLSTTPATHTITAQYLGAAGAYSASASRIDHPGRTRNASTSTSVASSVRHRSPGRSHLHRDRLGHRAGSGTPPSSDTVTFKDGATTISCGAGSVAFNGTTATCTVTYLDHDPAVPLDHRDLRRGRQLLAPRPQPQLSRESVNAHRRRPPSSTTTPSRCLRDNRDLHGDRLRNAPGAGTPPSSDTVTFKDGATTITCGAGSVAFNGTTATCTAVYANTTRHSLDHRGLRRGRQLRDLHLHGAERERG